MPLIAAKRKQLIHTINYLILSTVTIFLFLREIGLTPLKYFHTILLPQTDLFGEYLYARNIQDSGNPWTSDLLNYPDGSKYSIPFHLLFDLRRWVLLWAQTRFLHIGAIQAVNFSILLAFLLTSVSMYYVLTRLKLNSFFSIVLALIWSVSPWHILRIQHGYDFLDLSVIALVLLLLVEIATSDLSIIKPGLKRYEMICIIAWMLTSGSYYIYFSLLCISTVFAFTKLLRSNSKVAGKSEGTSQKLGYRSILRISLTGLFILLGQFIVGRILENLNSNSGGSQSLGRLYPDIWNYGGFPSSLFVSISGPFHHLYEKYWDAANSMKPGLMCNPDTIQSNLMKISCTKNYESFMFLNTGLMIVVLVSFITLILLRFSSPSQFLISRNKIKSRNPAIESIQQINLNTDFRTVLQRLVFSNFTLIFVSTTGAGSAAIGLLSTNIRVYGRLLIFVVGLSILITALFIRDFYNLKEGYKSGKIAYVLIALLLILSFLPSPKFADSFNAYQEVQNSYTDVTDVMKLHSNRQFQKCVFFQYPANTSIYPNTNRQIVFTEQQVFPYLLGSGLFTTAGMQGDSKINKFNLEFIYPLTIEAISADTNICYVSLLESGNQDYSNLRSKISNLGGELVYSGHWVLNLISASVNQRFYLYKLH